MKKITLFTVVAIAALSMTSCKKDRTCTCTLTEPGLSYSETIVVTKATKKSVEDGACASGTRTETQNGVAVAMVQTCTVK